LKKGRSEEKKRRRGEGGIIVRVCLPSCERTLLCHSLGANARKMKKRNTKGEEGEEKEKEQPSTLLPYQKTPFKRRGRTKSFAKKKGRKRKGNVAWLVCRFRCFCSPRAGEAKKRGHLKKKRKKKKKGRGGGERRGIEPTLWMITLSHFVLSHCRRAYPARKGKEKGGERLQGKKEKKKRKRRGETEGSWFPPLLQYLETSSSHDHGGAAKRKKEDAREKGKIALWYQLN